MHLRILLSAVCILMFFSCKCDRNTFVLGEEENVFIPYELGNIIRFKNVQTDSIIEFEVVFDEIREYEDGGGPSAMVGFPKFCQGSNDDTHQEREFRLESSECTIDYTVGTEGVPAGVRFGIFGCDISSYGSNSSGEIFLFEDGAYVADGIIYNNVYELPSSFTRVLVAHNVGILSFIDENTGDEYVYVN